MSIVTCKFFSIFFSSDKTIGESFLTSILSDTVSDGATKTLVLKMKGQFI